MGLLNEVASWFRKRPAAGPAPDASAHREIVSLLTPAQVQTLGMLPSFGICGVYEECRGERVFRENPAFVALMQAAIGHFGEGDSALAEAARRQRQGYVYVIDGRTPEGAAGAVPPQDIVGGFAIRDGALLPGGYQPNPAHRLVTADGLFKLPAAMEAFIVAEIFRAATEPARD